MRAALAERSGRPASALGHLRRGLADLHEWQSSFGSLDLQTMVTGHGRRLAVRGLRVASRSRSPKVLFEWSERARMLASRVQPVRVPHDEEVVADLAELRTLAAKEQATREDRAREAELRQRVRERAWRTRGSGAYDEPMPLADLQGRLDARVALLAHVVTAERVVALVVTSTGATTHDLGPTEALQSLLGGLLPGLDMAAAHLPDSFARTVRAESTNRLMRLDELLLAPLADELGDRQLVLTPSGVLAAVPWTLLPTNRSRPVIVAESATSWAARTETPLRSGSAGFVAGPRVPQAESEIERRLQGVAGTPSSSTGPRPRRRPSAGWLARSTSSTSRRMAGTRRRTHSSRVSSSPTDRGSAMTSTSSTGCPTSYSCRRARSVARPCAVARS